MVSRLLLCTLIVGGIVPPLFAAPLEYNRDIRPILAENCFRCHGPDSGSRKADLRLDRKESGVESGAIVPGNATESELIRRLESDDPEERMPPESTKKHLTPEQIARLKEWIAAGAEYQPHWSYLPPQAVTPPSVNGTWVRNPIDQFIAARLEQEGLTPNAEADRRTLARRASLDITGLVPDPREVEAFVADPSENAYEHYLDRLLAQPEWGEHRAHYWLDYARYGDTHGIHVDSFREMWSFREWVIQAFNRNQPFDQFSIEQLAGDLLESPNLDQQIASGFHRCQITTNESGIIDEEYLVLYARDRVETTSQVWLGMTAGCAVCHDHKFDPLSQREFYSLAAFFNNTTQPALDGNVRDSPPILPIPQQADRPRWLELADKLKENERQIAARRDSAHSDFDRWLSGHPERELRQRQVASERNVVGAINTEGSPSVSVTALQSSQTHDLPSGVKLVDGPAGTGALLTQSGDALEIEHFGELDGAHPFSMSFWFRCEDSTKNGVIWSHFAGEKDTVGWQLRLDDRRLIFQMVGKKGKENLQVSSEAQLANQNWQHVLLTSDGSQKAKGVVIYFDGERVPMKVMTDKLKGPTGSDAPLRLAHRAGQEVTENLTIQDLRFDSQTLSPADALDRARTSRLLWLLDSLAAGKEESKSQLYEKWLQVIDSTFQELSKTRSAMQAEHENLTKRGTVAYVMAERNTPPTAHVLKRGQYDQREAEVTPAVPECLPPLQKDAPRNRLGLAKWLFEENHPLTARVTVNRCWQEIFGTGLVRTAGDFGVAGEAPSHPELLDWLAVEFRHSGWNVKQLYKLMLMSATYRQSALVTPDKLAKDPQNRLLSRGPRFRMDAEMVRDVQLAASGTLVRRLGGPSVYPYQPAGVWESVAMKESNTREYHQGSGDELYRRSLYTFWKRAAPPAAMEIFNAPTREICTVRRERTNTPMQALQVLNDVQSIEAARSLAALALEQESQETAARLQFVAQRLLCRDLNSTELSLLEKSVDRLLTVYANDQAAAETLVKQGERPVPSSVAPSTLAAWTLVVSELLNLDEMLTK